jgi:hypothetical protein
MSWGACSIPYRASVRPCAAQHPQPYARVPLSMRGASTRRREFITLVGGAAASWPLVARAQQSDRMRRIGVLMLFAQTDQQAHADYAAFSAWDGPKGKIFGSTSVGRMAT